MAADPSSPRAVFDALADHSLLVVSGKGGVGRTTVAALLGLALAERGKRVLVATTGHDDRLAWLLGGRALTDTAQRVGPNLFMQRLLPRTCLREYGALMLRSEMASAAVFDNRLVRRLLRAMPGLDDFTILGKVWHEAVRAQRFDVVIFDGPATGHLKLVLGVPDAIREAIPAGPLVTEAEQIGGALRDAKTTAAVLVGLPERWPLTELTELAGSLNSELGIHVGATVVNGLLTRGLPRIPEARASSNEPLAQLFAAVDRIAARAEYQHGEVASWLAATEARGDEARRGAHGVIYLPWMAEGVEQPDVLRSMLEAVNVERSSLAAGVMAEAANTDVSAAEAEKVAVAEGSR